MDSRWGNSVRLYFRGSKITADGDCSHEIKRRLLLGRKVMTNLLLLLLLSRFSRVQLCAAHQAPPSLGFSRQEHWSGLPFPSPMHESEKWKWSHSVVSDLRNPMDCSLPGSSVHEIFQARVLEWVAIAFSVSKAANNLLQYFCLENPHGQRSLVDYMGSVGSQRVGYNERLITAQHSIAQSYQ